MTSAPMRNHNFNWWFEVKRYYSRRLFHEDDNRPRATKIYLYNGEKHRFYEPSDWGWHNWLYLMENGGETKIGYTLNNAGERMSKILHGGSYVLHNTKIIAYNCNKWKLHAHGFEMELQNRLGNYRKSSLDPNYGGLGEYRMNSGKTEVFKLPIEWVASEAYKIIQEYRPRDQLPQMEFAFEESA